MTSDASTLRLLAILAAVAVLVRWAFLLVSRATFEDSYISLRYAEHLAQGLGLVYNPGERVFGASTPLYVLFLAGLVKLQLPALSVAQTLAAIADGVTLFLWGRMLLRETRSPVAMGAFAALFGLTPVMVQISVSGMETSFALLFMTLALLWDREERPFLSGLVLGLLMLTRPDGALAAVVILAWRWQRTRRIPWQTALPAALIVLPWLAAAGSYYGTLIPNSIPAKAAAYNIHRPNCLPNFLDTLAYFAPMRGPWWRACITAVMFPALVAGVVAAVRRPTLRPLVMLFFVWWAYLVVPKTLLFTWYFPPLLLPAFVLAGLGTPAALRWLKALIRRGLQGSPRSPQLAAGLAAGLLAVGLLGGLPEIALRSRHLQSAERSVREAVGIWLRDNTAENALIAMEPIGYIGYFSQRRVLDEVGLVSPQMVPLNREGKGWFAKMLREYQPDYVVERPGYLVRNLTLNTRVPMFKEVAEREAFLSEYAAVATFVNIHVPVQLRHDYRFIVYQRRGAQEANRWRQAWSHLDDDSRAQLAYQALTGPVDLTTRTALVATPPRRP